MENDYTKKMQKNIFEGIVIPQPYPYSCPHYFTQDDKIPEIIKEKGPTEVVICPRVIRRIIRKDTLDTYIYWTCNKRRICRAACEFAHVEGKNSLTKY